MAPVSGRLNVRFIEARELLGGLIIVEVANLDAACAMAESPSLLQGPGAEVQVEAVGEH
jgi:hypothetical protein